MKYTKEFKLDCVNKYLNGIRIDNPGGCKHQTFMRKVIHWAAIYQQLGEAGLEHKKPGLSLKDKINICSRADQGETFNQIAITYGRAEAFISGIYRKYQSGGIDALKLDKRGRPPKMDKKKVELKLEGIKDSKEREKYLLKELEKAQIENEYLKKLSALVQKRMDQQQKKK